MRTIRRILDARMMGWVIGIVVDVAILMIIPGSSILEGILAFIAGISAGIAFMSKRRCRSDSLVLAT